MSADDPFGLNVYHGATSPPSVAATTNVRSPLSVFSDSSSSVTSPTWSQPSPTSPPARSLPPNGKLSAHSILAIPSVASSPDPPASSSLPATSSRASERHSSISTRWWPFTLTRPPSSTHDFDSVLQEGTDVSADRQDVTRIDSLIAPSAIRTWPLPWPRAPSRETTAGKALHAVGYLAQFIWPGACWWSVTTLLLLAHWVMVFAILGVGGADYASPASGNNFNVAALQQLGAVDASLVAGPYYQEWRYVVASIMNATFLDWFLATVFLGRYGYRVEGRLGALKACFAYFACGIGGWVFGCLVDPNSLRAGAWPSLNGIIAVNMVYTIINWKAIDNKGADVVFAAVYLVSTLIVGVVVSNCRWGSVGGWLSGVTLGGLLTPGVQRWSSRFAFRWHLAFTAATLCLFGPMIGVLYSQTLGLDPVPATTSFGPLIGSCSFLSKNSDNVQTVSTCQEYYVKSTTDMTLLQSLDKGVCGAVSSSWAATTWSTSGCIRRSAAGYCAYSTDLGATTIAVSYSETTSQAQASCVSPWQFSSKPFS